MPSAPPNATFFPEFEAKGYVADALDRFRALGLAGRIMHGSDFPNIPYPYAEQPSAWATTGCASSAGTPPPAWASPPGEQ